MKRNEGPFGKSGIDEEKFSVGNAPGICTEGEAIVSSSRGTDRAVEEVKPRAMLCLGIAFPGV